MSMELLIENFIKIGIAVLIGGVIDAEREFRAKPCGFRTIVLLTVGSTKYHDKFVSTMLKDTMIEEFIY